MAEQVGRWWNGRYGRLARADVWLYRDGDAWWVEERHGDGDAKRRVHDRADEAGARKLAGQLVAEDWRDLTDLY